MKKHALTITAIIAFITGMVGTPAAEAKESFRCESKNAYFYFTFYESTVNIWTTSLEAIPVSMPNCGNCTYTFPDQDQSAGGPAVFTDYEVTVKHNGDDLEVTHYSVHRRYPAGSKPWSGTSMTCEKKWWPF